VYGLPLCYPDRMNSGELEPWQANKLYLELRPAFHYLAKVQARMESQKFPADDRLYLEVKTARNAMQLLCKELHAIACRLGTSYGRK
jgi:hypothetical protein